MPAGGMGEELVLAGRPSPCGGRSIPTQATPLPHTCPPTCPPQHPRPQVVLRAIAPYTRVRIPFIARQLNVPAADVEQLLISLILDGRVQGRIDQVNQVRRVGGGWGVEGQGPTSCHPLTPPPLPVTRSCWSWTRSWRRRPSTRRWTSGRPSCSRCTSRWQPSWPSERPGRGPGVLSLSSMASPAARLAAPCP